MYICALKLQYFWKVKVILTNFSAGRNKQVLLTTDTEWGFLNFS